MSDFGVYIGPDKDLMGPLIPEACSRGVTFSLDPSTPDFEVTIAAAFVGVNADRPIRPSGDLTQRENTVIL
jgi:hypothetical protein